MTPGPRNALTDVPGIRVGHAQDMALLSGTTVVLPDEPAVAAVDCRGGGPGTRETDALQPSTLVEVAHAIVFSGGSAHGLEAASGVSAWLNEQGRGFPVGQGMVVPIVPAAILFDLHNGGDKTRMGERTYFELGKAAVAAGAEECQLGNVGAGTGAKCGSLKGGIGSASLVHGSGWIVGALAAVNAFGSATLPGRPEFWAWPLERNGEFGNRLPPAPEAELPLDYNFEGPFQELTNTTLAVVAVNAKLSRAQAQRLAIMAQDGLARALRPVHTPFDGDTVFVLATGVQALSPKNPVADVARLGQMGADCVARAIARGVYEAKTLGRHPGYQQTYPSSS